MRGKNKQRSNIKSLNVIEKKHLLMLFFADIFFILMLPIMDYKLKTLNDNPFVIYGFGFYLFLTLMCSIFLYYIIKKDNCLQSLWGAVALFNFLGGFFLCLSIPALLQLKALNHQIFNTVICIVLFVWFYQFLAYKNITQKIWGTEFIHSLGAKISKSKTYEQRLNIITKDLNIDIDYQFPKCLSMLKGPLYVVLVVAMLLGLNLRKVWPLESALMWSIPVLLAASLCFGVLAYSIARVKLLKQLEKEFPSIAVNK